MNSKYFTLIVNQYDKSNMKYITHNDIENCCKNLPNIRDYFFILHDKDLKNDGSSVVPHFHINICFDNNGYEEMTVLHKFASFLMCNIVLIQINATNSKEFKNYNRYLIHLDNEDKYKYPYKEIFTNNRENLDKCIDNINPYDMDIDYILFVIKKSKNLAECFSTLGLRYTNQYYKVIKSLWDCKNVI